MVALLRLFTQNEVNYSAMTFKSLLNFIMAELSVSVVLDLLKTHLLDCKLVAEVSD